MILSVPNLLTLFCALYSTTVTADGGSKYSRTKPDRGALVVDGSGKYPGSYLNISAAVLKLHNETSAQKIFIFGGVYEEQVYFPPRRGPLTVQGETGDARGYKDNLVTITGNLSRQVPGLTSNDQTATVRLWHPNVKIYNLIISNTFGQASTGGQALALSAQNTNQAFYGCKFTGYQDTIYANTGRQIYAKSYINGAVDFIFGLRAVAWFDKCDIESIGAGYITANGREAANNTSFYVFNEVNVGGSSGVNSTVLGRPWRQWSRVVFQKSYLGDVVKPAGWSRWDNTQSVENVYYREFENLGPGAGVQGRVEWSGQLEREVKAAELFGKGFEKENWVDGKYLS
ncbi:carbohydrate esterase family 8 protein [Plenodomus tracheiphilus IPT5]|uniref:Pectinesterase n=1 Tax=Plenodomus tracheiphilus IPT5 TaxID=1408161 RepID=A0A6A7B164_9PLEO|nr:carbohydrate esterase family 8 protein [Plenodomus tracheiphilus IPT5]